MLLKTAKEVPVLSADSVESWDALIPEWNRSLTPLSAKERVEWACESFQDGVVLSTSFGIQSAVMLHLVTQVRPDMPVIFVDTGYLFPETYRFADELAERLNLNLKKYIPLRTAAEQEALHGKRWEQSKEDLIQYNLENKVEPMNRAVKELGAVAWLVGLRREQSSTRGDLEWVRRQNRILKIHPILNWSNRDVYRYLTENNLPYHPLWEQGYVSVGDWHSTSKLEPGMREEDTRFNGMKRECGLHEGGNGVDFQI